MIILLLCWTFTIQQDVEWLEYFAGTGNLTRVMTAAQYKSFRFDILDNNRPANRRSNFMDLTEASGFALATLWLLRAVEDNFALHLGLKCSSFSKMNVGTSSRSACTSIGWEKFASVLIGNCLLERSCLLILLATALGGCWSLEQPGGALTEFYPTFRHTIQSIFQNGGPTAVQCVRWWMGHYNSSTPKRHYAYSNSTSVLKIDKGVLQGWKRKGKKKVTTAERYVDASGRKRYKGTSKLRGTEVYPMPFAREFCDLVEELKSNVQGKPQLPDPIPSALETFHHGFELANPELYRQVNLASVYNYLRRSKQLRIPHDWLPFMPEQL
ncbi:unnamed protein product [Cladocopium goreaui]|uniref:Uncharacterized protein n=1 Tax=Cladocopium goreaui TaxID=2562237 RepID=A0A9P1LZ52_9DINO|nr:unnamed protein product [Cladocopium goreaui]